MRKKTSFPITYCIITCPVTPIFGPGHWRFSVRVIQNFCHFICQDLLPGKDGGALPRSGDQAAASRSQKSAPLY